ncbi:major facilitator superfamily domain-containing protein [Talaromyces proteolyticus]|uniref:Major facilitator superfamily domain-containing protein n=1 Tax=Talaromyces proteolyticus TaxID=1131652 RepID=A0AAD4Q524_9EURO|nr:major facilitator superfamily domain-containing protein [Talaromyces proteolyticus]KAH8703595.1 major facilitator superfamily domain-containing protein [Talaromyces proteolyticus]
MADEKRPDNTSIASTLNGDAADAIEKHPAAPTHAVESSSYPPSVNRAQETTEPADFMSNKEDAEDATAITVTRTQSEPQYISGFRLYALLGSLTLVFFLVMIDMSIVATAIPSITSRFHSLEDVGWYGSSYQLACASLQPLAGKLYSNFRSKWTFLVFFGIFELGSLLCGVATSSKMLIIARAIAGIGGSGLINGGLTIISASIPLHKRPKYFGILMGLSQMGIVCGPLLGGAFTTYVSWRWCFYINLPVGAVAAVFLLFIQPPETVKPRTLPVLEIIRTKLDLIGFALFAPASIQFFLALDYGGNQYAWNSSVVIGLFCGSGATLIVFLVWEYFEGDNAMLPFSMIKLRPVWTSCLVMLFYFGCVQVSSYYIPIYFQTVRQKSALLSGVYTLPNIIAQLFTAVTSGVIIGRVGYYLPFIVASCMLWAVSGGLMSTFSLTTSTGRWIGYQILMGFARGLGMQVPMIAVQNALPPNMVPVSMALISFCQTFGGAVWLTFGETILSTTLRQNLQKYAPDVDAAAVIDAGASGVDQAVHGNAAMLMEVLVAYSKSINAIFYLVAGTSCAMMVVSCFMGWKDIRKKDKKKEEQVADKDPEVGLEKDGETKGSKSEA